MKSDTVKNSKNNYNDDVNEKVDERGYSTGNDDDIFGEVDLTHNVAARDDGVHPHRSGFGKEVPEDGTGEEVYGIVRDIATEFKKPDEDDIENSEQEEGTEHRPEVAKSGFLVADFEVSFDEFFK